MSGRLLLFLALVLPTRAQAQTGSPPNCQAPEHHQFDFWLGDWNVTANDKPAGTNSITSTLDGCVLHEHWRGQQGFRGESFNYYDRTSGTWHQLWVDQAGNILRLAGHYGEGIMTLEGDGKSRDGTPIRNRIRWYRNSDGTVRQLWDATSDGGQTWKVLFDGLYRK